MSLSGFVAKKPLNWLRTRAKGVLSSRQVLAYPKCGNTWLRLMMYKASCVEQGIDDERYLSDYHVSLTGLPNIMWSHRTRHRRDLVGNDNTDPNLRFNRLTLFIVRDPRDVLVSCYYHEVFRNGPGVYSVDEWSEMFSGAASGSSPSIAAYTRSAIRGIDFVIHFFNHWLSVQGDFADFQIVRYEDLRSNPVPTLIKAMGFLKLPVSERSAKVAIEFSSFENMRQIEMANTMPQADLARPSASESASGDSRSFKVRKGVIGGYLDELDDEVVALVNEAVGKRLHPTFGYTETGRLGTL
jgi:hypothetical protein